MDAMERAEKIGKAARAARDQALWTGDKLTPTDEYYRRIALAAVRAAYEIDGVDDLLKAAETAISAMEIYPCVAPRSNAAARLFEAASRVREAMGGQT